MKVVSKDYIRSLDTLYFKTILKIAVTNSFEVAGTITLNLNLKLSYILIGGIAAMITTIISQAM